MEVEQGVAAGLARTLHNTLLIHNLSGRSCYRNSLNDNEGLHIAVLSSSLAMVLRCSKVTLASHVHKFQAELILSLQRITEIFLSWVGDATIQQIVLSNTAKIVGYILPHVRCAAEKLVGILTEILKGNVSADIRIDAASAIARFFEDPECPVLPEVLTKLEENASLLISILSTASIAPLEDGLEDAMIGLYKLAQVARVIRTKMVKRRCTILAVTRYLSSADAMKRDHALRFCQNVFSDSECLDSLSSGLSDNARMLTDGLIQSALNEHEPKLRKIALCLLGKVVSTENFPFMAALDTLRTVSYKGDYDDIVIESATAYCKGVQSLPFSVHDMATVVDFTTFPYARVRSEALETLNIKTTSDDPKFALLLLTETDLLENFGLIIKHGSIEDCLATMDIVRQLARSAAYHHALCLHSGFLGAVVDLVAREKILHRGAHYFGIETLLALLSNQSNIKAFLSFRPLLPWLVSFVNTTTADDDFKKEVVTAIIRLSQAMLE